MRETASSPSRSASLSACQVGSATSVPATLLTLGLLTGTLRPPSGKDDGSSE